MYMLSVLRGRSSRGRPVLHSLIVGLALVLGACGGGGGSGMGAAENGTVQIGMTDADGDFVRYAVDVASLDLTKADGTVVHTLPSVTRVDFAQYADLTEFLTAASVPAGRYTKASITLDFATADIQVEVNGNAVAVPAGGITDPLGNPLGLYTLQVQMDRLDNGQPLLVRAGLPRFLSVDFNLDASNTVDLTNPASPAVEVAPFLVADIDQVPQKDLRVRGALVRVDTGNSTYTVDLHPFDHRDDDAGFGQATVHVDAGTSFEINGTSSVGAAGLQALQMAGPGTPTVATGTFTVADHSFLAATVEAGDSVPGHRNDAILGTVVARNGDMLTVRGATLIRSNDSVVFNDSVAVTVGPDTAVRKRGDASAQLDIGAISVGQRVEIRGIVTNSSAQSLAVDATAGRVALLLTTIGGTLNSAVTGAGPLDLKLQHIDGRRLSLFDFAGTGAATDADPAGYAVDTGALSLTMAQGTPVRAIGFVVPFGAATATDDFEARTVVDLTAGHARLGIGWGLAGTIAPFSSLNDTGLVLDLGNPDIGARHHVIIGGVVVDLESLPSSPTIVGPAAGEACFAIKQGDSLQVFSNFSDFVTALMGLIDGTNKVYGLYAEGHYDGALGVFTARTVGVTVGTMPMP